MRAPTLGIVAPSSKVPPVEFALGLEVLAEEGFAYRLHPQCRKEYLFFAGNDEQRAEAFFEYAIDPGIQALWCARGGSGAARILPILDKLTAERGIPERKLLAGYSDATVLLEYVRTRWGWATLHAPMPGIRAFCNLTSVERKSLFQWVSGERPAMPWGKKRLRFAGKAPKKSIEGELIGGNLAVWTSLIGTPYAPLDRGLSGKILFFEDIGEGLYRLDRMIQQIRLAGGFRGVQAVVLGNFEGCVDVPPNVLAKLPSPRARARVLKSPKPKDFGPLRQKFDADKTIPRLFKEACAEYKIPVAYGLPVGHGPGHAALPLGAQYRLAPNGAFELIEWDWKG